MSGTCPIKALTALTLCLRLQTSEPAQRLDRLDFQAAAHPHRHSGIQSRVSPAQACGSFSTSSSAHQSQTQSLQQSPQAQAEPRAPEGGVPPGLANTLEHIIGQLDVLTQVSRRCADLS